jgi:hypothetical protein
MFLDFMKGTYGELIFKNKENQKISLPFPFHNKMCNSTYLITSTENCWLCRVTIDINSGSAISQNFSNYYIYITINKNFNREFLNC